jgi:hypothetical protein
VANKKTGRPSKLTPEVKETIIQALRAGNYAETAARVAGIGPSTFFLWKQKGEAGEQPYADFLEAIAAAEAVAESRAVAIIANAMLQDAKHAEWFLERKLQKRWGRHDRTEVVGEGGGPVKFTLNLAKAQGQLED